MSDFKKFIDWFIYGVKCSALVFLCVSVGWGGVSAVWHVGDKLMPLGPGNTALFWISFMLMVVIAILFIGLVLALIWKTVRTIKNPPK